MVGLVAKRQVYNLIINLKLHYKLAEKNLIAQ